MNKLPDWFSIKPKMTPGMIKAAKKMIDPKAFSGLVIPETKHSGTSDSIKVMYEIFEKYAILCTGVPKEFMEQPMKRFGVWYADFSNRQYATTKFGGIFEYTALDTAINYAQKYFNNVSVTVIEFDAPLLDWMFSVKDYPAKTWDELENWLTNKEIEQRRGVET